MKKRTLLALAVAMSVTAVAAANPFSDVPAKHWAYASVTKLEKAGIVEGYGDNTYRGDRTMTRYEMAQIIARALANSEKADAALKAELDKLSVEFAKELKNLGVRVTALENQQQNVKFSGDLRMRYRASEDGAWLQSFDKTGKMTNDGKNRQDVRVRIQAEGKVNDNWTVVTRFGASDDLRDPVEPSALSNGATGVVMDKMFVKGQFGDFGTRLGRFDIVPAYGIMFDDNMDGVELTWQNEHFYGALRYGNLNTGGIPTLTSPLLPAFGKHYDAYMAELGFLNVVKGLNIRGQYTFIDADWGNGGVWEAGLDYTFGNSGFKATFAAADTTGDLSASGDDTAWIAQIDYKGAKKSVVNSWGIFGGYQDFQDSFAPLDTTYETNGKGWFVGGSFTPAKNIVLKAWYEDMKAPYSILGDESKSYVRAQAEFFF